MVLSKVLALWLLATPSDNSVDIEDPFETVISVERVEVDSPRFRTCLNKGLSRFVRFRAPGRRTELRVSFHLRPKATHSKEG